VEKDFGVNLHKNTTNKKTPNKTNKKQKQYGTKRTR